MENEYKLWWEESTDMPNPIMKKAQNELPNNGQGLSGAVQYSLCTCRRAALMQYITLVPEAADIAEVFHHSSYRVSQYLLIDRADILPPTPTLTPISCPTSCSPFCGNNWRNLSGRGLVIGQTRCANRKSGPGVESS
ncbi:hypothetical protein J6590_035928 [Homalodisca vitripennis]|nr:hypothetical protein J6590_035928 [Homalodisca vitripennis]